MLRAFLLLLSLIITGCDQSENGDYFPQTTETHPSAETVYSFGVHPLHNPQRLYEVFGPLMDYLSDNIPHARFRLEASRNYAAFDKKLYARQFHFALPNPFQTIKAIDHGYRVFAKMGDDDNFRGIILVRKDSGITSIADLKGQIVSYPAPTALAAAMMPQFYLQTHGIDVMNDVDNQYVGSQESAIMNVFLGQSDAGSTWPLPWQALSQQRPEVAEQLTVIAETKPLLNNGVIALAGIDTDIVRQVSDLLTNLHQHEQGREILQRMELSCFEAANNDSYAPVRNFINVFSSTVRPVD